ncbi:class I SAM-dependent methyltransferase [Algoriphagus aquimarinus]|uniref:Methyltransferase domain-containing protein n=1 Tax=Algoriphagus aquimarinus TaxID=237018 RepID=A0A1I1CGR4_9BACT|nr:class I SAM-dependent methyltransferase [Algoriphagus aquimarinus]SFB60088.1 Methyltransferase domain-containing protein [Algoriphagus aquimarinus]
MVEVKFDENLSKHEQKDMELFNSISRKYLNKDLSIHSSLARKERLMSSLQYANIQKTDRILEIGCGAGFSVKYLDIPYSEYVGVDYSEGLIDYAIRYNSSEKAKFICANIRDFKPEEKFDLVFMIGVLHHFDDFEVIMEHIVDLLKPGAVLIANEPQSSNKIVQLLRQFRTKFDKGYSEDQIQFLPHELEKIFQKSGMEKVQTFSQGYFSTPFAEVILKPTWLFYPITKVSIFFDQLIQKNSKNIMGWNVVGLGVKSIKDKTND